MTKAENELYVNGLGRIVHCYDDSFDIALEKILKKSDELISARDLVFARLNYGGNNNSVSQVGSYVREGTLFVPRSDDKRILLRESLVLKNVKGAVNAHRKHDDYLLPKNFSVDNHLEKIGKNNYLVVNDTMSIPTSRFGEEDIPVFLFQDQAKEYGQFLDNAGIFYFDINMICADFLIDQQLRPFANQLRFHYRGDRNGYNYSICGNNKLCEDSRVRGLLRDTIGKKNTKSLEKSL